MDLPKVSLDEKTGKFTISGDIPKNPPTSKSTKSFLLATTNGNPSVGTYKGKDVKLGLNMYYENDDYDPAKDPTKKNKKKKKRRDDDDDE